MSHSQFHCTGRAYLDMHGLIFETSICYWQDQPGRGKREHTEPGVPGRGARATRRWHEAEAAAAAAAGGAGGRPHPHPTSGEGAGRRRTPGPDRQPAPPAARTADRLRSGPRGVAARRRDVAAWRDEGGGKGGGPAGGPSPRTSAPHPTNQSGAARNLGGPGAGPRAPAGRSGGRPARARSPALTRSHGRGAAGARAEARRPLSPSPPARRERGVAGTAAGPRRPAGGVPTTRARASAPGRGAARQGDGRRSPQPRPTRNDAGGRAAAAAADHGAAPRQAREAKHTGTRPGGRQTRRTGRMDGRETGPTRRGWLGRRRSGGAAATSRKTGRAGADARRREGGPGAILRARTRVGRRGTTRGLTARGLQRRGGPAAPRTPTGLLGPPTRVPPLAGLAPTAAKHPRAAASPATTTLSRAHTGRPTRPATRLRRRARLPPASGTVSTPPGDAAGRGGRGGRHPHVGEAGSIPDGEGGTEGWGPGRAGGHGEGAARTHTHSGEGRGAGARGRPPRDRKGRGTAGPARETSAGSHRHTHTRGRSHDAWDAGRPRPPWGLPRPGPAAGARVRRFPPRVTRRDPSAQTPPPPSSPHPPSSESDPRGSRAPGKRSRARRPAPCPHTAPGRDSRRGQARRAPRGCGTGESGRPCVPEPRLGLATARGHRTRAHTRATRPRAGRRPGGTLPRLRGGEARAAVGKERRSAPPRGRRKPSREGEGLCRPRGSGGGHRGHRTLGEGQRLGGPVPQGSLSDR